MEKKCDHIVAITAKYKIEEGSKLEITVGAVRIRASKYSKYYHEVFNNEKFDYCPCCGAKINWRALEDSVGQVKWLRKD